MVDLAGLQMTKVIQKACCSLHKEFVSIDFIEEEHKSMW